MVLVSPKDSSDITNVRQKVSSKSSPLIIIEASVTNPSTLFDDAFTTLTCTLAIALNSEQLTV